ncbi:MAG: cyanophycin synthetase, partial [bacterium]|nr:cyanophycin synthetase [bacterium]
KIKEGLKEFTLTKGRQTIIEKKYLTIIDDSYNASLDSVKSAIDVLNNFKTRRVAILGDILETGSYNEEIHKNIGAYLPKKIDFLIAVGPSSKYIIDEAIKQGFNKDNIVHFDNYENLLTNITKLLQKNDTVLVKASHGIKLYEVVEYLNKFYE